MKYLVMLVLIVTLAEPAVARSVYLNGIDISGATEQLMKDVNIRIDAKGDIFIEAPQYQVHEEATFTPLSQYVESQRATAHSKPGAMPKGQVPNPDPKKEAPPHLEGAVPESAKPMPATPTPKQGSKEPDE